MKFGDRVVGWSPHDRERIWTEAKRAFRKYDRVGIGPVDTALWDLAVKLHNAPIHKLLGTYRERFTAYVSTYFATDEGGFESPVDYAEKCLEAGSPAFKLHT